MGTDIRIEKTEKEKGTWFVYFRLDGHVQVGIADNGFLVMFKKSCQQNILDKETVSTICRPLKRIGDTDNTLAGRKKIKIHRKHQHMRDHRVLQDEGDCQDIVRPQKEIGRIKRLEKSRAAAMHEENTATVTTFHQVTDIEPSTVPLDNDYVSEEMIYRPIPSGEETYSKPFKCLKCRKVMKRRKTAGWCKPCLAIINS